MIFKQSSQHLLCRNSEIGCWQWEWSRRDKFGKDCFFCLYLSSGNYIVLYGLFRVSKGFVVRAVFEFKLYHLLVV